MPLPLKESRAVGELAKLMVDFLPGSGSSVWKGQVSFMTVANKVGVGDFFQGGTKLPMLTALFEKTLERRRDKFEPLILEIVRAGMTYRLNKGTPVTSGEITEANRLIKVIGFKFPDLWDPAFLSGLSDDAPEAVQAATVDADLAAKQKEEARRERSKAMADLKDEFIALCQDPNRNRAGTKLEVILNKLFKIHDLSPREPFRLAGEQIDGSFELDNNVYLIEAKWEKDPIQAKDLYIFRAKVEGKSAFTRGVFVSINGVTANAKEEITGGKQPLFFIVDGHDLMMLLSDFVELPLFLRRRRRFLAEEGRVSVPFPETTSA